MTERFSVGGALLVTLFGRLDRARPVRRPGRRGPRHRHQDRHERPVVLHRAGLVAALATALVYGVGGNLAIDGTLTVGTLIALAGLLGQLYGPLTR